MSTGAIYARVSSDRQKEEHTIPQSKFLILTEINKKLQPSTAMQ